jgi:hypothetical protein
MMSHFHVIITALDVGTRQRIRRRGLLPHVRHVGYQFGRKARQWKWLARSEYWGFRLGSFYWMDKDAIRRFGELAIVNMV